MDIIENPFEEVEWRDAVLVFDNGGRMRAKVKMPQRQKIWHDELERRMVREFNKTQTHIKHKLIKVHILRK